jgi:TolA-binding protein
MGAAKCVEAQRCERAFPAADPSLRAHLDQCASCTAAWTELARVAELARALPWSLPSTEAREQLRTELLARAPERAPAEARVRWARVVAVAGVAAAIAIGTWAVHRTPRAWHGTVVAVGAARFDHLGPSSDEVVHLVDGSIDVEVSPLDHGDRFRVLTDDGEVEVRGTAFRVTAQRGRLEEVRVVHGRVAVRAPSSARELGPGEKWRSIEVAERPVVAPSTQDAAAPPVPTVAAAPPRRVVAPHHPTLVHPAPHGAGASDAERAFDDGWRALREGDYANAATRFGRAAAGPPGEPIVEDATYWSGVSLARGGRSTEAAAAMRSFLDRFPTSAHAAEATSILGWLDLAARDLDGAERCFRTLEHDPDPRLAESARRGLSTVAAQRAH